MAEREQLLMDLKGFTSGLFKKVLMNLDVSNIEWICDMREFEDKCKSSTREGKYEPSIWESKYKQLYGKRLLDKTSSWRDNLVNMMVIGTGDNRSGQLGLSDTMNRHTSKAITGFRYPKTIYISTGLHHTALVDEEGNVWTFGDNTYGQLGLGTGSKVVDTPRQIDPRFFRVGGQPVRITKVSAGGFHTVCLDIKGNVWTFGWNKDGQLGLGDKEETGETVATPQQIPGLSRITQVSAGHRHTVCLNIKGNVWGFGLNRDGQLGLGLGFNEVTIPKQVPGLSGITQVSAGHRHTVCLNIKGNVWSFGWNQSGQLGLGDDAEEISIWRAGEGIEKIVNKPQRISDESLPIKITQISAGDLHTVCVDKDGNVWGFGDNIFGQLGLGLEAEGIVFTPQQIPGLSNIIQVSAGGLHTVLIAEDSRLISFGRGNEGQLSTPNKAFQVSAGGDHTIFIGLL